MIKRNKIDLWQSPAAAIMVPMAALASFMTPPAPPGPAIAAAIEAASDLADGVALQANRSTGFEQ
jgi:hypothetical protein